MASRARQLLLGSMVAGLLLAACGDDYKMQDVTPDSYTQSDDSANVVTLILVGGGQDNSPSAKVISQDSNEVVVSAELNSFQGSQTGQAAPYRASVTLAAPLNGRTVRDDSGVEIPADDGRWG